MAKTNMLCPFSHRKCDECAVYRGRHYYLSLCKGYRGYISGEKENAKPGANHQSIDFKALKNLMEPWSDADHEVKTGPEIKLKVIDMENGETRTCQPDEAKAWDWNDPQTLRFIDGCQITSWDELIGVMSYKARKGYEEVKLYEGPRFMLLGGG